MLSRQDNDFQEKKTITTFGQLILPLTLLIALGLLFFSIKLFFYTPLNPESDNIMEEESKQIERTINDRKAEAAAGANAETAEKKQPASSDVQPAKSAKTDEKHVSIALAKPISKTSTPQVKTAAQPENAETKLAKPEKKQMPKRDKTAEKQGRTAEKEKQPHTAQPVAKASKQEQKAAKGESTQKNAVAAKTAKSDDKQKAVASAGEKQTKTAAKAEAKAEKQTTAGTATNSTKQDKQSKAKRWDVQIGGFADKDRALAVMKKAQSEGYKAYMCEGTSNNAPFYRIRVKGSEDRKAAEKLSEELAGKKYPVYLAEVE